MEKAEKCDCNGNENQYFDVVDFDCANKVPTGVYEKSLQHGMSNCWDVCQINPADKRCPKEPIENIQLLNLFKIFEYLSGNINISNPYTKSLISKANHTVYDNTLKDLDFELVCAIGKAKILPTGVLNGELANIINIYGAVLWINTVNTPYDSTETIEAMGDLGCSTGNLNVYFQGIENKYNFNKINSVEELTLLINIENFINEIKNSIIKIYEMFNNNQKEFLNINWKEGDKIGGNGSGSYNPKYKWFYVIHFLMENKNIREIPGIFFEFSKQVKEKYEQIKEKAMLFPEFYTKYIKYKNKYLKLKKDLNKIN